MKKILGLTVALIAVIAMLGTGTWAYFNDINVVESNTITAGTLKFGTPTNTALAVSNKGPGATGSQKIVDNVENAGSLNGVLKVTLENLVNKENTRDSVELFSGDTNDGTTTNGELGSKLTVVFWVDRNTDGDYDAGVDSYILPNGTVVNSGALAYATLNSYSSLSMAGIAVNATTVLGDLWFSYDYPQSATKLTGGIYSAVATVPGSGYAVGNVLTITDGAAAGGTVLVATIDGSGGVTGVTLDTAGTGYSSGTKATTGGAGTLATVTIKASGRYNTDNVTQGDSAEVDIVLELTQTP